MTKPPGKRMQPRWGGEPCPLPPICYPQMGHSRLIKAAEDYCKLLEKELATGDDDKPKWDAAQAQQIRHRYKAWRLRALGEDSHYMKHGTFPRPIESEPVSRMEVQVEKQRRRYLLKHGTYPETNTAHYQRTHRNASQRIHDAVRRLAKKNKTGEAKPPDD